MPIVKRHPQIEGAYLVEVTPSEPSPSGNIGVSVTLDQTRVRGTTGSPATITVSVTTSSPVTTVTPALVPTDTEITIGTVTGSGTSWTFDLTVAKSGSASSARAISVTVSDGTDTGVGSASFTVDLEPPSAPTGVSAVGVSYGVQVSWLASPYLDVRSYNVYVHTAATPTDGSVKTLAGVAYGTVFTHSPLDPGTQRWYWVTAVDDVGNESPVSSQVTALALGDVRLTMDLLTTRVSGDNAVIQGTVTADQTIDGSWLQFSLSPADTDVAISTASPTGSGTVFTFTLTVNKSTVGTVVRTVIVQLDTTASGGKSGVATASFVIDTEAPGAVIGLASEARIDGIRLRWTPPADTDVAYYYVYRGTSSTLYGRVVDSTFYDSETVGTSRQYWVRTVDTVGNLGELAGPITAQARQIVTDDIADDAIGLSQLDLTQAYRANVQPAVDPATTFVVSGTTITVTNFRLWQSGVGYPASGPLAWSSSSVAVGDLLWYRKGESQLRVANRTGFDATFNEALGDVLLGEIGADTFTQSWNSTVVRTGQLLANAVTAQTIAANAVTASKIAAGAVTATKLGIVNAAYDPGKFTPDSPTAGSISWANLTVVADGVSHTITDGSGSGFYVWFDRSAGTLATSGTSTGGFTGFGFDALDGDVLLGFNNDGTFVPHWAGTVVRGDTIQTGTVEAKHITVNTLSALSADIGVVRAGKIVDTATEAASRRGIRLAYQYTGTGGTETYGFPTGWANADAYFIDLAAGITGAGNDFFIRAGDLFKIQVGSAPSLSVKGKITADGQLDATTIKSTGNITTDAALLGRSLEVEATGGWGDPSKARFSIANNQFTMSHGARTYTASAATSTTISVASATWVPDGLIGVEVYSSSAAAVAIVTGNTATTLTLDRALGHTAGATFELRGAPQALLGTYTIPGVGAAAYTHTSWSLTSASAAVNTGTVESSQVTTGNVLSGKTAASNSVYTVTITLEASLLSLTPLDGATQWQGWMDVVGTVLYRTSAGGAWATADRGWLTATMSNISGFENTPFKTVQLTIPVTVGGSLTYLEFASKVSATTTADGLQGNGLGRILNGQVTWSNAGSGSSTRRNVRLFGSGSPNYAPHLTLDPLMALPSADLGRRGDLISVSDGTTTKPWFHDGTDWLDLTSGTGGGGGGGLSGSGTTGTVALWSGTTSLGSSVLTQSGSAISLAGTLATTGTITMGGSTVATQSYVTSAISAITSVSQATYLMMQDTRSVATTPASYDKRIAFNFKTASVVGLPTATYAGLLTIAPWSDDTGGPAYELGFNSGLYFRYGTEAGGWGSWGKVVLASVSTGAVTLSGPITATGVTSTGALSVLGNVTVGSSSATSVGIDLGNSLASGTAPYLDFHYGVGSAQDYSARMIASAAGSLTLTFASGSGQLTVEGKARVNQTTTGSAWQRAGVVIVSPNNLSAGITFLCSGFYGAQIYLDGGGTFHFKNDTDSVYVPIRVAGLTATTGNFSGSVSAGSVTATSASFVTGATIAGRPVTTVIIDSEAPSGTAPDGALWCRV